MNQGFAEFLRARPQDRRDVFLGAARRLGTPEQNVEKDFWVTWTLDALFNINGGAIIDHKAPRKRRFVAVQK
jgi:hypothetical protein